MDTTCLIHSILSTREGLGRRRREKERKGKRSKEKRTYTPKIRQQGAQEKGRAKEDGSNGCTRGRCLDLGDKEPASGKEVKELRGVDG